MKYAWDFFIAHAGPDKKKAEQLYDLLSPRFRVFVDSRCILAGDNWDARMTEAQRAARVTVVLVSKKTESAYYQREEIAAAIALARRGETTHRVVPVLLDRDVANLPYGLSLKHGLDAKKEKGLPGVARRLTELATTLGFADKENVRPIQIVSTAPARDPSDRYFAYVERPDLTRHLEDAVFKGTAVLVGLAGAGGVGKTTLAKRFAEKHAAEFATVAFVDVREGGGRTTSVAEALLVRLGEQPANIATPDVGAKMVVTALERSAAEGKKTLVIFDNADYPDDALAGFIDAVAYAPRCKVLVTTRKPEFGKALRGKQIDVGAFAESDAVACLKMWLDDDERRGDEAGLLKVVRHVGCIPIWVQLAGRYLHREGTALAEYVQGNGAFDHVRQKLGPLTHSLFVACGACAATGFTIAAAAGATGVTEPDALEGLRRLEDWSVVSSHAGARFALHPLLREIARSEPGFINAANHHADWVLGVMGAFTRELAPVEAVREEVAAAVENTKQTGDRLRLWKLCLRAEWNWRYRGPWGFAGEALDRAIVAARKEGSENWLSQLLSARAEILQTAGDWDAALILYGEKEQLDGHRGEGISRARALKQIVYILRHRDELDGARAKLEEAIRLEEEGNAGERLRSITQAEVAGLESRAGRHPEALDQYRQILAVQATGRKQPLLKGETSHGTRKTGESAPPSRRSTAHLRAIRRLKVGGGLPPSSLSPQIVTADSAEAAAL